MIGLYALYGRKTFGGQTTRLSPVPDPTTSVGDSWRPVLASSIRSSFFVEVMEEAVHAHLRQPMLKILHSHGITRASSVSLHVLSSLLDKYLKSTVESCQEYANHAGRVNLNVYDVLESLEEMGTVLDDLRDYLEVECGVSRKEGDDNQLATTSAEVQGMLKYARAVNPRKEAELHEFGGKCL